MREQPTLQHFLNPFKNPDLLDLLPFERTFGKRNIPLCHAEVRTRSLVEGAIAAALVTIVAHDTQGQIRPFPQCPAPATSVTSALDAQGTGVSSLRESKDIARQ
jgi:hypothetical protein